MASNTAMDVLPPGAMGATEFTNPTIQAELICRVVFGFLAIVACWVPFRLLAKNGEFAASVFCINVMIINFIYIVNSLIWRDDNFASWFDGTGWCDLQNYILFPMSTIYAACVFAIMRHLAMQLGLMRATTLTSAEKRRRNLIQALIIFPVPILQVALTYPTLSVRYAIGTLKGCKTFQDNNWGHLVFFVLPTPIFVLGAVWAAGVTYVRFRELNKATRAALASNSTATARGNRARRKLYLMALSILVPFAPIEFTFMALNIMAVPWTKPWDVSALHDPPEMWNFIPRFSYADLNFIELHHNYISVLTAIPIFVFFGTSKEAINTWRKYLLFVGLGKVFKGLNREYDPDQPRQQNTGSLQSWGNSTSASGTTTTTEVHSSGTAINPIPLLRPAPCSWAKQAAAYQLTTIRITRTMDSKGKNKSPEYQLPDINNIGTATTLSNSSTSPVNPQLLAYNHHAAPNNDDDDIIARAPRRNPPFLFRTAMASLPPMKMPPFPLKLFSNRKSSGASSKTSPTSDMTPLQTVTTPPTVTVERTCSRCHGRGRTPLKSSESESESRRNRNGNDLLDNIPSGSAVETRVWSSDDRRREAVVVPQGHSHSQTQQDQPQLSSVVSAAEKKKGSGGPSSASSSRGGSRATSPMPLALPLHGGVHVQTQIATSSIKKDNISDGNDINKTYIGVGF